MNNKRLGTTFERRLCLWLARQGWWVHFITPDRTGAQPFDIIAVRSRRAIAIDCKTTSKSTVSISRLEENQKLSFERWIECGNEMPKVAFEYEGRIYFVDYYELKNNKSIDLRHERSYTDAE